MLLAMKFRETFPQRLKPLPIEPGFGTAEAVLLPNRIREGQKRADAARELSATGHGCEAQLAGLLSPADICCNE
jgi:hypothetical protein